MEDLVELLGTYLLFGRKDVNPCPTVGPLVATLRDQRDSDSVDGDSERLERKILDLFVLISADGVFAPCLMGDQVIEYCVRACEVQTADDFGRGPESSQGVGFNE